jgi:DNA-binding NarL/FixJ family response regulator
MARITVVNDHPAFLETMYTILDGMDGHEVTGFEGEETTLDQLVDSAPELLIVDLRIAGHRRLWARRPRAPSRSRAAGQRCEASSGSRTAADTRALHVVDATAEV